MWRACSWRATDWAVRRGISRGFCTRACPAAEVEGEAGLIEGLAGAGIDVHDHLADGAAEESGGGHGEMARNTGSNSPPLRTGQGRAPGAARVSPCAGRGGWGSAPCGARPFLACLLPVLLTSRRFRAGVSPVWARVWIERELLGLTAELLAPAAAEQGGLPRDDHRRWELG